MAAPKKKPGRPAVIPDTQELMGIFAIAALHNGSMEEAAKIVNKERKEKGLEPYRADTLRAHRRRHRELYERTAKEMLESVRLAKSEKYRAAADDAIDIAGKIGKRLGEVLDTTPEKIPERDLAGAWRNAITVVGILTDKDLALTGDAQTGPTFNFNFNEQVRGLAARGARFFNDKGEELKPEEIIEGQATELPAKEDESA